MLLIPLALVGILARDGLAVEKPDRYDINMAETDRFYLNSLDHDITAEKLKKEEVYQRVDDHAEKLNKLLDSNSIYSLTSSDLWNRIYEYLVEHLDEFLKNGNLFFKIHMRYSLCTYIMPLLPTDYILVFPSFYKILIPSKFKKIKAVSDFLKSLDKFFTLVKQRSKTEILPTFVFKRSGSLKDDLIVIKRIPELIKTNPSSLVSWLFNFTVEKQSLTDHVLDKAKEPNKPSDLNNLQMN